MHIPLRTLEKMKFFALLVFCGVGYYNVLEAPESQWSLLRQSEYDVKFEIARVESFNRSYLKQLKMEAVPYNRTYRAINATIQYAVNCYKNLLGAVQLYKFLSNEYRFFPLTVEFDACTEFNYDTFGMKQLLGGNSHYDPCFNKKDVVYHVVNAMPDFSKWPPHIPYGRYKMQLDIFDKNNRNNIATIVVNMEIKEKPRNWS